MMNTILKAVLILALLGNVVWLAMNAFTFFGDLADTDENVEKAVNHVTAIERRRQLLKSDLEKIADKKWVKVKDVNVALTNQLRAIGINPLNDGVVVPGDPRVGNVGRDFTEQVWKITFTDRNKTFRARDIARFCSNVERDMPGYQIKSVDLGNREKVWGKDEWKPASIEVRRLTRKEKN